MLCFHHFHDGEDSVLRCVLVLWTEVIFRGSKLWEAMVCHLLCGDQQDSWRWFNSSPHALNLSGFATIEVNVQQLGRTCVGEWVIFQKEDISVPWWQFSLIPNDMPCWNWWLQQQKRSCVCPPMRIYAPLERRKLSPCKSLSDPSPIQPNGTSSPACTLIAEAEYAWLLNGVCALAAWPTTNNAMFVCLFLAPGWAHVKLWLQTQSLAGEWLVSGHSSPAGLTQSSLFHACISICVPLQ